MYAASDAPGRDVACARLAAGRHGVITRSEALAAGITAQGIYRRTRSGEWARLLPGIYVVGLGHDPWRQSLSALTKWSGGVASHRSAAALLELDGFDRGPLEISSERRLRPPWHDVVMHHVSALPSDSTIVAAIRTTSATRTLIDVSAVDDRDRVELALEDALRRKLTSLPRLRWALDTEEVRRRPGVKALRSLVAGVERSKRVTESGFETRLHQELRKRGVPLPVRQFEIKQGRRTVARPDFSYPDRKLIVEAVSYRWHSGRTAWARDQSRANELAALGWRLINVTWEDLRDRPDQTIGRVDRALRLGSLDED